MRGPGRMLKALMDLFPSLGPTMTRISGAESLMAAVADYREAASGTHADARIGA